MDKKTDILVVDDKPQNLIAIEAVLESPGLSIIKAFSGNEALALALEYDVALILLDVQMPGMDGFETAKLLRGNSGTRHIPIIFVTASSRDHHHIFKGYKSGAVDYIFKPLDPEILKGKVAVFCDLHRQKKIIEEKNAALEAANTKILEQRDELVQKERLKAMLQMSGAATHEMSQPVMVLMGLLDLMAVNNNDPAEFLKLLPRLKASGRKIAGAIHKIQTIQADITVKHDGGTEIIDLDRQQGPGQSSKLNRQKE